MAQRVLITGGAGFIGSHLVRRLLDRGDEVHALVRPETSLHRLVDTTGALRIHTMRLADDEALATCLAEAAPEQVYHLAAETRLTARADFSGATLSVREDLWNLITLLAALSKLPRPPAVFVRAGSIAEYGSAPVPYHEDQKEQPETPYGAGLAAGTMYLHVLESVLPFPAATARLALVFGPGQSESFLIPALIRACIDGKPFHVSRPSDRRDLIYIDDVIEALLLLADSPQPGCHAINIATGVAPTMREVAGQIIDATGADPALVEFGDQATGPGISELLASPERAHRLLDWSATTSLSEGIRQTVAAIPRSRAMTAQGAM